MECSKLKNWIIPYIYKDVSSTKKTKIEKHLSGCPDCKNMLDDYNKILGNVQKNELQKPPSHLDTMILSKARQNSYVKTKVTERRSFIKPFYPSWALAAAFLGVIMIIIHVTPRINNYFSSNIAKLEDSQKLDKQDSSKINIVSLSPLKLSTPNSLKNVVKSNLNEEKADMKQDNTPDDPYNKHPFAPYDDSVKVYQAPSDVDLAAYQHERGVALKNQGRCQDANNIFENIIRDYPRYQKIKNVYIDSADCYSKLGQKYDAVTQLQKYLEIYPQEEEVLKKLIEEIDK
jgi:tetratricopeptide (TPR) repeat protein